MWRRCRPTISRGAVRARGMSASRIGPRAIPEEGGKGRPCPGHSWRGSWSLSASWQRWSFSWAGDSWTRWPIGPSPPPSGSRIARRTDGSRSIPGRPSLGLRTGAASSQINVRRYSAALPHYQRTFIAAFVPPGQFPEQQPNPLMALARAEVDTLLNQSAGKLLEERDLTWHDLPVREIVMELSEKRIVIERILLAPRSKETSRVSWPSKDKASALTALRSRASSARSSSIRLPGQNPIPIRIPIPDRDGDRNRIQTRTRSQRRARTS